MDYSLICLLRSHFSGFETNLLWRLTIVTYKKFYKVISNNINYCSMAL